MKMTENVYPIPIEGNHRCDLYGKAILDKKADSCEGCKVVACPARGIYAGPQTSLERITKLEADVNVEKLRATLAESELAEKLKSLDITGSEGVEVKIRHDGKVLWINTVEGGCVLRICQIKELVLDDERSK
jgi:hypothetical protein